MRNYPKSHADWIAFVQGLIKGAEGSLDEVSGFKLDVEKVRKMLGDLITTGSEEDKLKSLLKTASEKHSKALEAVKSETSKWISILEGQYGKQSEKLIPFGIAPRKTRSKSKGE